MDLTAWSPTGRRVAGPSADLVELNGPGGIATAIEFHPRWHGDPGLVAATELGASFLSMPMVVGLVDLHGADPAHGVCLYRTGSVRSVAEWIHHGRVEGKRVSRVAALQLACLAAEILEEAAETGASQGVFSHGDLSPWRLTLRASGDVQILGYGVPCPDLRTSILDPARVPKVESARYAPPERWMGNPEGASSDLYSLVLLVVELMRGGTPLIEGTAHQLRDAAVNGTVTRRLEALAGELGAPVVKVLAPAVAFDPAARYDSGHDLSAAIADLLAGARGGADLATAVAPVFAATEGRLLTPTARAPAPAERPAAAGVPSEAPAASGRWTAPARPDAPVPADPKEALRRRLRDGAPEATAPTAPPIAPPADPKEALRRRLRETAPEPSPPLDPKEALRRRLRESTPDVGPAPPSPAPVAGASVPVEPEAPRRRRPLEAAPEPDPPPEDAPRRRRALTVDDPAAEAEPARRRRLIPE